MATAKIEVPHVYQGLAEILKSLSVQKNGTLPGNMGGKSYITAVDASAETKRQFVENGLIFLPDEEVIKHETIIHKERLNIAIVIKGTYTIVSTKDGSSVTVSGTGDGLATGTAVASNIGSTNALKNALLRTFLITEQSVEEASKNGVEPPATTAQRKIEKARSAPTSPKKATGAKKAKDVIRDEWVTAGKTDKDTANRLVEQEKANGLTGDALFDRVLARLQEGDTE